MKQILRFSGIAGLVLLVFGALGSLLVRDALQPLMMAHLILAVVLIVLWFLQAGGESFTRTREVVTGRGGRFAFNAVTFSVVFLGIIIAVNWLAARYERRIDLTVDKRFSLTTQSAEILKRVTKPVKLVALKFGAQDERAFQDLLELYRLANPGKVSVEFVNPQTQPHLVELYQFKPGNVLYIGLGEEGSRLESRINDTTEEGVTNALLKLIRGESKKIYVVAGLGGPDLTLGNDGGLTQFSDALRDQQYQVEQIVLGTVAAVPEDAAAVLLIAPKRSLRPEERDVLVSYARNGGRLLLFHDPRTSGDIRQIAAEFGISVGNDVVIEPELRLFQGPVVSWQPLIEQFELSDITKDLGPQAPVILTQASSVVKAANVPDGGTVTELMKTSANSWGESNLALLFGSERPTVSRDADDLSGPLAVAASFEREISTEAGSSTEPQFKRMTRVVVFGDSDFIQNGWFNQYGNRDLALNAVTWAVGEEGGIGARPKTQQALRPISATVFTNLFVTSFLIPELLLLVGLFIWWRRKHAYLVGA